jgi:uncharacterized protein with FMN-binding domain
MLGVCSGRRDLIAWLCGAVLVAGALWAGAASGGDPGANPGFAPGAASQPARTKAEVDKLIDEAGKTPPPWWDSTPLTIPPGIDLTWTPRPAAGQQSMVLYVFNTIMPNAGRWREGVKLLQHTLTLNKDKPAAQQSAAQWLTLLYTKMLRDYARGAFWARKMSGPASDMYLVECYLKLGCRPEAVNLLNKIGANKQPNPMVIMLWGELGDAKTAMQWAEDMAVKSTQPILSAMLYLAAGDACQQAGDVPNTLKYYGKVLAVPEDKNNANLNRALQRYQGFAKSRLEATKLIDGLDLNKIPDGVYKDSSIGYVGALEVTVTVKDHRLEKVEVTNHKENRAYSSITEVPQNILNKQSVKGVDMVTGATITSEAIINASAKALSGAQK